MSWFKQILCWSDNEDKIRSVDIQNSQCTIVCCQKTSDNTNKDDVDGFKSRCCCYCLIPKPENDRPDKCGKKTAA